MTNETTGVWHSWPAIACAIRHPLVVAAVQLIGALVIAYAFTERWQLSRQRRDFQYKALCTFSEASNSVHAKLLPFAGRNLGASKNADQLKEFRDEFSALRMQMLAARDGAAAVFCGLTVPRECNAYFGAIQCLFDVSIGTRECSRQEFEKLTESLIAHRQLVLNLMATEAKLLPVAEFLKLAEALERKINRSAPNEDRPEWWHYITDRRRRPPARWMVPLIGCLRWGLRRWR